MSDTPRTDAIKIRCGFQAVPEPMLQHAYELERENAALRAELGWKTERLKLLSDCLHNIDGLIKKTATSIFVDALDAARKEAPP